MGGAIKQKEDSIKRCLRSALAAAGLTQDDLSTVLVGLEAASNCNSLTYQNEEGDSQQLTPYHPLVGSRILLPSDYVNRDLYFCNNDYGFNLSKGFCRTKRNARTL